jgi:disulfide bond formation protein DsbB
MGMSRVAILACYGVFTVALLATVGSLAMSEAFGLLPCMLCWYQRICMYPLVIIMGVSILRRETTWPYTVLPLAIIGWLIALYHSLLQWGVISEKLAPCVEGVSCVSKQIDWFGFVTIPFMSLVAFSIIIALSVLYLKGVSDDQRS